MEQSKIISETFVDIGSNRVAVQLWPRGVQLWWGAKEGRFVAFDPRDLEFWFLPKERLAALYDGERWNLAAVRALLGTVIVEALVAYG